MASTIDLTSPSPDSTGMRLPGAQTLSQLAEKRVLESLSEAVEGYQSTASYCCGGSLPITMPSLPPKPQYVVPIANKPPKTIALRWDMPEHDGSAQKVEFPLAASDIESTKAQALFEQLLKTCAPATFGRNNEDILDESYRKAGKLDRDQFSVDFHPHDYAIIDAIGQILLPQINVGFLKERDEHRGVLAELYKVNIYSGPSGKFQAHVDTPRGPTQFGSLVVCLPHPHEGGQLRVSHKDHSTFFDWSNTDSKEIQWAAFYSDCEHEVLEVKSGHRITLTYNLYVTEQVGGVLQRNPTADPSLFPLYEGAKQILSQPNFMKNGGTLGFYCTYKYAHHTSRASALMPWALKGVDVAIYSVFRSLGLDVFARPILVSNRKIEGLWLSKVETHYEENMNSETGEWEEPDLPTTEPTRVGTDFHATVVDGSGGHDMDWGEELENLEGNWPHEEHHNITWLNSPKGDELAMVGMTYGNQAELDWAYSRAAILVTVPPRAVRDLSSRKVEEPPVERGHVDVAVF